MKNPASQVKPHESHVFGEGLTDQNFPLNRKQRLQ